MVRETSKAAYAKIKAEGLLSRKRFEVYEALFKLGRPSTCREIFRILTHERMQQARLNELRDLGVIYERGERECTVSGHVVIEYDLTDNLPKEREAQEKPPKYVTVEEAEKLLEKRSKFRYFIAYPGRQMEII